MHRPLVSIIIPTYNRGSFLKETLNSVISQSYQNWECIVVDDGSTDFTRDLMSVFCKADSRFSYWHRPSDRKKGASSCRNYGYEKSKGELVQFLDSDDLLDPNKIKEQVIKSESFSMATLYTCRWGGFTDRKDLSSRFKYRYNIYKSFKNPVSLLRTMGQNNEFFPPHTYLTPRKLINQAGGWNEELTNNDDAEFFVRVILMASKVEFVSNSVVYYRYSSGGQLSILDSEAKVLSAIKSWQIIENHLKNRFSEKKMEYVKAGKYNLFSKVKGEYPQILAEHSEFFKDRRRYDPWFSTLRGKLKKKLRNNF